MKILGIILFVIAVFLGGFGGISAMRIKGDDPHMLFNMLGDIALLLFGIFILLLSNMFIHSP